MEWVMLAGVLVIVVVSTLLHVKHAYDAHTERMREYIDDLDARFADMTRVTRSLAMRIKRIESARLKEKQTVTRGIVIPEDERSGR